MPKKKDIVKGGTTPVARIRENSRLMQTHESMVDFINGRHSGTSIFDVFASGLLGFDFLRTFEGELDDDIIYSDDDEDDDHFYTPTSAHRSLEPHPRIKQLTEEEADRHARELIEEEERRKDKTEKNKRKKLRKKQKKRLEKESAVKDNLPEEEQEGSDSSENPKDNPVFENNAEASVSPEPDATHNGSVAAGYEENSCNNQEDNLSEMITKEDEEQMDLQDLNINNSHASTSKSVPEVLCNERTARERKNTNTKLPQVQPSKEEKPKIVEQPEVHEKKEEKYEPHKEKPMDPYAEELAKSSRELAGMGNRLAASGQYDMAVKCFTDAIKYNPKEFKLFGNRSLCYERMQQYEKALQDAELALSMEPNWIKGLFRKGKALCGLKRYYEASLIYKEVLNLESSSAEATQELKRAQTLHLMEMGFSWAHSSEALKTHATLEEAVEALFGGEDGKHCPGDLGASREDLEPPVLQEEDDDEGEWTVLHSTRPRMQQVKESDAFGNSRSKSQSPTPHSRNAVKSDLMSVWVGSLAPAVTYSTLHELFSRAGTVYSIKMLLEQQCAFVNYAKKEDCDRAIDCINGLVVEGAPLSVRYPNRLTGLGVPRSADPYARPGPYKKECFFWRTSGCTRQDCTFRHLPENKNIDKDKFTSRLGNFNM
ncbi:reticulocyte-binding protein homolog 2a isoform X2 [Eleginops maclovinus]|uniref:reticulocyte-binding protein homolog 2a isoform X2 n=1 Tax=Eleginops maclovinus TaxID=56733 RepID=UPI00307FE096